MLRIGPCQNIAVIVLAEEVGESGILRDWAAAECTNPERWSLGIPEGLRQRLRDGTQVTEQGWIALENVMRQFWAPLLDGLRTLGTRWYAATMGVDDLSDIRLITCEPFISAVPSLLLNDLAIAVWQWFSKNRFLGPVL